MAEVTDIPDQQQPPVKKPAFDPNKPFKSDSQSGKPAFDPNKPSDPVKKKDAGSPAPSGSSPNPNQTEPPVGTWGSNQKQATANFKNNSVQPTDLQPHIAGPNLVQVAAAINNKGKNLDAWRTAGENSYVSGLVDSKKKVTDQLNEINSNEKSRAIYEASHPGELAKLEASEKDLTGKIQRQYDERKKKLVPELVTNLQSMLGGDLSTIYDDSKKKGKDALGMDVQHPLEWNDQTHQLTEKSVNWVLGRVDGIMNKKKDPAVNATVSGDVDDKERVYQDLGMEVVNQLNLVPVHKKQQEFKKEFASRHPEIEKALKSNEEIGTYFSTHNFDDLNAKIKIDIDHNNILTQDRYYGKDGIFNRNEQYIGISHKYAQLVGDGKMDKAVALKQIDAEVDQNPELKKIRDNYKKEILKEVDDGRKKYEDWVIQGLQKEHPGYTVYSDGSVGIAGMPEDKYKNMVQRFSDGMDDVARSMGYESDAAIKKLSNKKAESVGPFLASLGMSMNAIGSGVTKMLFNKTGWGGEKVRNFEAAEMNPTAIPKSDVAASWNWKGWESIVDPKFYLSSVGQMMPVIAGGAAISAVTEGAGAPAYIEWLANAGLFTAQSSISTYNQLLNTKGADGNMLSESDAAHMAAKQASEDFLPNFLMMALTSGSILRGKNIAPPTLGKTVAKGLLGAAEAQPFFTWQGYNDYSTMKEAQGGKTDFWDYMQSKDFKDNLVNGLVMGGALGVVHAPGAFMKNMDNWQRLVHTSEGEFKSLLSQNHALGQEMNGKGDYLRDALKMHILNSDVDGMSEEGRRELADKKNMLLYSTNLDRNLKTGNLDRTNINDLYQAHHLSLADQYDFLSSQATEKGNKTLADIYSDKAKSYREEAKAAANDQAKFHYLTSSEGTPIFVSDPVFKTLEADGKLRQWVTDGTIKSVHKSDDPDFSSRFQEFVKAKNESEVEVKPMNEYGKDLVEQNKDKLGDYYEFAKENTGQFYKEVAQQVFGHNADGSTSAHGNTEETARKVFGNDIVDLAKILYGGTEEDIKAQSQLEGQRRSEVNQLINRMNGAEFINEKDLNAAANHLYDILDDNDKRTDLSDEQKKSVANLIEPLISKIEGYDFRTTTKTSTTTEKVPNFVAREVKPKAIKPALEQSAGSSATVTLPEGGERRGTLNLRDGQYVLDVPGGQQIVLGEKAISDRDLRLPEESEMENPIQFDEDGNVKSVTFKTSNGDLVTVTDSERALDLAIQLRADAIGEVSDQQFDTVYDEVTKETTEEVPVKDAASGEGKGDKKPEKTETPVKEAPDKETTPKEEKTVPKETAPKPAPQPRVPKESPKEEFTAVRKEALKRDMGFAKELFKKKSIPWPEQYDSAMSNVMSMYPGKSLFEAMRSRVEQFAKKVEKGELFAPTHEDIAVFNVFRNEVGHRLAELQGWDSESTLDRQASLIEKDLLKNDLYNLAAAAWEGKSQSGRALQSLQAEVNIDPEAGLKLRRMDVMGWKGGEKLTKAEMDWTDEMWNKEQDLARRAKGVTDKKMNEGFQRELSRIKSDYERKLKEARAEAKPSQADKREKALSERGKAFADWIRGGKFRKDQAYSVPFPGFTQTVNFVLETLAQAVEKGATLAEAIDGFLKEHKGKNKDQFTRDLFTLLDKQDLMSYSFEKIQKLANTEGASGITNGMVSKNLDRDFLDSHVGLHQTDKVLDAAYDSLKSILPDLQRDKMVEAYLKQGDYAQPTKSKLEDGFKEQKRNFDKLVKIEKDISDLKNKNDLFKQKSSLLSPYEKAVSEKEKELQALMETMGIKSTPEDKYRKASYEGRATSHNDRLDGIQNAILDKVSGPELPSKVQKSLEKLFDLLGDAKIQLDPTSGLSQDRSLEGGLSELKSIRSEFNRSTVDNISQVADLNRMLGRAVDAFASDKEESEQQIKLNRAKDQARRDMDNFFGKISRGEYENHPPVILSKTDAELIKLERDRDAVKQLYRDKQRQYQKDSKTNVRRVADFARSLMVDWMIGGYMTIAKVLGSAVVRPNLEALTKLTFGKLFEHLPFETTKAITDRAKAGGESQSLRSIGAGYRAYLGAYSQDQMKNIYTKLDAAYQKADKNWRDAQGKVSDKELNQLKNKRDDALVSAVSSSMFQYISGNSFKEAWEVFMHRSTQMERQFGDFDRESWNKNPGLLNKLDNIQYIANYAGRSHAALKNFSARQSFAAGFMSRVEYAVSHGEDVSTPERIIELAHDSYLDWERGKYQESNWVSDTWNKLTNKIDQASPEAAYLFRSDIAITRVPVNILREAVYEYAAGFVKGGVQAAREYYKAKGVVLQDGYTPENQAQFEKELKEQLQQIDPRQAATIVRAFRKGGVGLGMYALSIYGAISFGGWAHRGQTAEDKKKMQRELDTGHPEIKTSEIQIGNWKVPEAVGKIMEHMPAFYPTGFASGLVQVYKNNVVDGKTTKEAAFNALTAQVEHAVNSIPQSELITYLGGKTLDHIKPSGQWDDVDQTGTPIKRKAFHLSDYLIHLPGFSKKGALSEGYYKQATQTQRSYRDQITEVETNMSLSSSQKEEQRQILLKELDESIDEIYRQNKENPE